jgi:hypothetical protein
VGTRPHQDATTFRQGAGNVSICSGGSIGCTDVFIWLEIGQTAAWVVPGTAAEHRQTLRIASLHEAAAPAGQNVTLRLETTPVRVFFCVSTLEGQQQPEQLPSCRFAPRHDPM